MNAVTGVGAPWYTSGVHMWNGAAATLKPSPTSRNAKPATSDAGVRRGRASAEERARCPVSDVVPVAP